MVNSPNHYKLDGLDIEVKDVIKSVLGKNIRYFYLGNVIKYMLRAEKKNWLEDYKKAQLYLDWMIDEMELKSVDELKKIEPRYLDELWGVDDDKSKEK